MAKTKTKPGPKSSRENGRGFYVVFPGPLADAFEQAAKDYAEEQRELGNRVYGNGIRAYVEHIIRERPEIASLLRSQNEFPEDVKIDLQTP